MLKLSTLSLLCCTVSLQLFVDVQDEVIHKVIADLTDKIKEHPLDVRSLEYDSKLYYY